MIDRKNPEAEIPLLTKEGPGEVGFPPSALLPFPPSVLCLVTDRRRFAGRLEAVVEAAVAGGVNVVQFRERDLPEEECLKLALALREITRGRALLIVNRRPAMAECVGADGVHWPEREFFSGGTPLAEAQPVHAPGGVRKPTLKAPFLVGCSVHSLEGARRAASADYLIAGHVFSTASHPEEPPRGLGFLREVCAAASQPVIAIGGITAENAAECMQAGAAGIAVLSAIGAAPNPEAAARSLRAALVPAN